MRTLLYLHGFSSSPGGRKVALLREALEPEGWRLVVPDLNVPSFERLDFGAMVAVAAEAARAAPPDVLVGSSLGALVALEASRPSPGPPLVLISPALGIASHWASALPRGDPVVVFHHGAMRALPIHRAFFESLARARPGHEPPAAPVTIVTGCRDESVPYELVREVWLGWSAAGRLAEGSEFVSVSDGDHGLTGHARILADAIRRRAR